MTELAVSPNLALNQDVARRRAAGEPVVHLGFGEAGLPVLAPLADRLVAGAHRTGYGPVAGDDAARDAVAGWFDRRRLPTDPSQIVLAAGSKPLLMALNLLLPGDTVLPIPCWNTYAPQAALAGRGVVGVPIPPKYGGVPDPRVLRERVRAARRAGRDPRSVVITLPDNPTGTTAPPGAVRAVCEVAESEDLWIVSDEIYRDVLHDPATELVSPAELVPDRTIVTTGLSKSLALGGWRIGAARFPVSPGGRSLRDGTVALASEMWSALAGPMQEVAAYAFAEPPPVRERLAASARLHGAVARAVHRRLTAAGASCRPPTGAFYVYPDFAPLAGPLARRGVTDSESLRKCLLEDFGVAVLAGHLLGDDPTALRAKMATSLLYGETAELRHRALSSSDPAAEPHVADVLDRLSAVFAELAR